MTETVTFEYEESLQEGVTGVVVGLLSKPDSGGHLGQLLEATFGFVENITTDITGKQPPPKPLACKEGCSYCCLGFEVHVSPLEALSIAEHIAHAFEADDIKSLVLRTLETQEAKERHSPDEEPRINFTCPLLKNDRCMVYAVRPFTCRGFNSYDAGNCERRKVHHDTSVTIEGYVHPRRISQCVLNGFQLGLAKVGLDGHLLDLTPALLITLTNPDAKEQWLAGEDVFEKARVRLTEA